MASLTIWTPKNELWKISDLTQYLLQECRARGNVARLIPIPPHQSFDSIMLMADVRDAMVSEPATDALSSLAVCISWILIITPVKLSVSGFATRIGRPLPKVTSSVDWKPDTQGVRRIFLEELIECQLEAIPPANEGYSF
jgi:hypothetical protein